MPRTAKLPNIWNILDDPLTEYWLTYYVDKKTDKCTICDDAGQLELVTNKVLFCICPNGRELRKASTEKKQC